MKLWQRAFVRQHRFAIGAAGVLALLVLGRRRPLEQQPPGAAAPMGVWGTGWHFPVPDLVVDGEAYAAKATQEFKGAAHPGLDIMYQRKSATDRPEYPAGVVDAFGAKQSAQWFAPPATPVLAAKDGRVSWVGPSTNGIGVIINHGAPWSTFYMHLRQALVSVGENVQGGDKIGVMGHGEGDAQKLRHLHFETRLGGDSSPAVDPTSVLDRFARSTWRT